MIIMGKQIKGLLSHPGKLYYEQSVLSDDNAFNYLLNWCNETLSTMVRNPEIKRRLMVLSILIPKPTSRFKIPVETLLPPQYQYYKDAVRIANDMAIGISAIHQETGRKGYGYVIATASVFEKFIEKTLKQIILYGRNMEVEAQVRNIFAIAKDSEMKSFFTVPDNKVFLNGKPIMLIDAKYKTSFLGVTSLKPSNADAYQLFSSLVSHNCKHGILISPCDGNIQTSTKIWEIPYDNSRHIIALILINLRDISSNTSFARLKAELENEVMKVLEYGN